MTVVRLWTVEDRVHKGLSERWVYQQIKEGKLKAEKVPPHGSGNWYWLIEESNAAGIRLVHD